MSAYRGLQQVQAKSAVRAWLRRGAQYVSFEEFHAKCVDAGVADSTAFLRGLEGTGSVVYKGGVLNLHPEQVFNEITASAGVAAEECEHYMARQALEEKLRPMEEKKAAIDQKAELWRRKIWARTLAYCGFQMALFSRFTFVDFEWDIMEPVSWLVVQFNAVLFFGWMYRHGVEHTHEMYDAMILKKLSNRLYQHHGFNVARWQKLKSAVDALTAKHASGLKFL
eukprot:TRINITY_DN32089_c0_g1_i1.p2 TRINITY_DN32089_c0_g1~~TRINITY_DN32089_c0_g1_i1.p2  ORF type:complete len:224 (+),score=99.45 TRINITY_DN32089_c0_g1_i1:83-754(+)